MVHFFLAAGFNGAYILVDDFERIPDFQSARQKKDFALELRSVLFDGSNQNARFGFYNFILVLHAGVPRLISDAWAESGMENRSPISNKIDSRHIIPFEKLSQEDTELLISRYLKEYRVVKDDRRLHPFTQKGIQKIGEMSEFNAAKILRMAYDLLEKACDAKAIEIDDKFVISNSLDAFEIEDNETAKPLEDVESIDLQRKSKSKK